MSLFRLTFSVELLVEAPDQATAIYEGRYELRGAEQELRRARVSAVLIEHPEDLSALEARALPWGRRSAKRCAELAEEARLLAALEASVRRQVELFPEAARG